MKLAKLLVSLACCLLFSAPLWAASIPPLDETPPNPSGLYALSHLAAPGSVTELTDQELAKIEGKRCDFLVGCDAGGTVPGKIVTSIKSGEATVSTLLNVLYVNGITPIVISPDIDIIIGPIRP